MPPRRRNSSQTPAGSPGQQQQQGAVYGPRSALTSFLREQGITGAQPQFRPRTGQRLAAAATPEVREDHESTTGITLTSAAAANGTHDGTQVTPVVDPTNANADAGPSNATAVPSKRTATESEGAPSKKTKATSKQKAKKPEGVDDNGFSLGGSSLPAPVPKQGRYESRPVGSFAVCAECGKKFTVSKYTASNPKGPGVLCQPCMTETIEERAAFPGAKAAGAAGSGASTPNTKRPKIQKKRSQKGVDETLYTPVVTLQQACLAIISQYIRDVDQLGDLGPKNLDKIAKIVSKHRALDDANLKLFLDVGHRELKLYDCTKITDSALGSISTFAPHLHSLTLLQCGRLDDDVLDAWMHPRTGFKELRNLTLYAPYLVRTAKWKEWFEMMGAGGEGAEERRPELETFQLRMSSRFDETALEAFVEHNPHVVHLQLSELGKLTSDSLALLHPLAHPDGSDSEPLLRSLDLARLGTPQGQVLEDDAVISLLSHIGSNLERLVLDGNIHLTERTLTEGVRRYCHRLRELSLSDCEGIGGDGVEALMVGRWPGQVEEAEEEETSAAGDGKPDGEGGEARDDGAAAASDEAMTATAAAVDDAGPSTGEGADAEMVQGAGLANGASTTAAATDGATEANGIEPAAHEADDAPLFEPGKPWRSPGLTYLNLHRITTLTPSALSAILKHSAHSLQDVNFHSCDELDGDALYMLAKRAERIEILDLSFVRAVDNFVVQALLDQSEKLRVLFLHGNNRVTSDVPRKRGVHLRGLENAFYTEIPAGVPWEW